MLYPPPGNCGIDKSGGWSTILGQLRLVEQIKGVLGYGAVVRAQVHCPLQENYTRDETDR